MPEVRDYSLQELSEATGVQMRTIRLYLEHGLLAGPSSMGRGARYGQADLERLLLIRDMREREGLPLKEIRHRLAVLEPQERRQAVSAPGSALDYLNTVLGAQAEPVPRSLLRRGRGKAESRLHLEVTPDLELVWKGPATAPYLEMLDRLAERIREELVAPKGDQQSENKS